MHGNPAQPGFRILFPLLHFAALCCCHFFVYMTELSMVILSNEILLLKAQSEDGKDKYETILLENHFTVKHLKVLDFEYINQEILREKLENFVSYSGLIFTSPRAANATKLCLTNLKTWLDKDNFVVGETTFNFLNTELNLKCKGKESGNANNLANIILKGTYNKPFLFPCGNLKTDILTKRLCDKISVDAITVYETVKSNNLVRDFMNLTSNFTKIPEFFVYFSPSGVEFTVDLFKLYINEFNKVKFVAIGPSTEEALTNANLPVFSVALKPNENELLNAILK